MTHKKRLPAPRHYPIARKGLTYVSTIKGSRSPENAVPTVLFLREIVEFAESEKEAKEIVRKGAVLRNGEPIRDIKEGIGVLDTVEIPAIEETYRVVRDGEKLKFVSVTDSEKSIAKIVDKSADGESFVYRLHNGENFRTDTEYETGNTLVFNSNVKEVELEEGAQVAVIDGKHAGKSGEVQKINERGMNPDTALVEDGEEFETKFENLVAFESIDLGDL